MLPRVEMAPHRRLHFLPTPGPSPLRTGPGPPGPRRRCGPHLLLGQVFLNTFFLGTLDYKKKTIVIPMVQVCPGGGRKGAGTGGCHRGGVSVAL